MPKFSTGKDGLPIKKCSVCKKEKPLALFQRDKINPDGFRYECQSCRKDAIQHYNSKRRKHPDKKVAMEKSKRFFLQETTWNWIGPKRERKDKEFRERQRARRRWKRDSKSRNETDDILDEFGY